MTRIAIVGSRGFLAKYFADEAHRRGWAVSPLDRPEADVLDRAGLQRALEAAKPDVVVNFAAIAFVGGGDDRAFYDVNAWGQANLLAALKAMNFAGTHVFISSANIYGTTAAVSKETDAPAPVNHYGCSKVLAESFCRFMGGEFRTYIVRPFNCIGVGQPVHFLGPKIIDAFRRRLPELTMGNMNIERDFVDARDFALMMASLIANGSPHPILNFCNGEAVSIPALIEAASRISGHTLEVRSDAGFQRANDLTRQIGDNSRIREAGWRRTYSIDETLGWMLSA